MKILLRRSNKIGSRIIRFFSREEYSHIGIQFADTVMHSDAHGARISSYEEFVKDSDVCVHPIQITPAQEDLILRRCLEKLKTPYDFLGIVGFAVLLIAMRLRLIHKMYPLNPKWMMCSEFVEYALFGEVTTKTPVQVLEKWHENQI